MSVATNVCNKWFALHNHDFSVFFYAPFDVLTWHIEQKYKTCWMSSTMQRKKNHNKKFHKHPNNFGGQTT